MHALSCLRMMGADLDHFDRRIVFSPESEHKSLYEWSLNELDAEGKPMGRDWIPWSWTLYFKAKEILLHEGWKISDRYPSDETTGKRETENRKFIQAELFPFSHSRWPPTFSMLGTDRNMSKFVLRIEQIPDDEEERCIVDGYVSYTTEIDFRDVSEDDALWFYFHLHAATFADFAERVASGKVDGLTVRVGRVAGFYSDWSPSITAENIRILTAHGEHKVEGVPENVTLRRLGEVGEAELYFSREATLSGPAKESDEAEEVDSGLDEQPLNAELELNDQTSQLEFAREKRAQETVRLIKSLRTAAWAAAALLLALLFK